MYLILLLLLAAPASAATTLHATTTTSGLAPMQIQGVQGGCSKTSPTTPWDYFYFLLDNTAPSAGTSESFIPTSTSPTCFFQRASGSQYMFFVSKPLSAGATMSATISGNCAGLESATGLNGGCSFLVYKWDGKLQGLADIVWTSGTTAEYGTSCAAKAIASGSPISTTFATGDRIIVIPVVQASGGTWGG